MLLSWCFQCGSHQNQSLLCHPSRVIDPKCLWESLELSQPATCFWTVNHRLSQYWTEARLKCTGSMMQKLSPKRLHSNCTAVCCKPQYPVCNKNAQFGFIWIVHPILSLRSKHVRQLWCYGEPATSQRWSFDQCHTSWASYRRKCSSHSPHEQRISQLWFTPEVSWAPHCLQYREGLVHMNSDKNINNNMTCMWLHPLHSSQLLLPKHECRPLT